ncbi:MAG TPA: aspartate--tRNA(Asn) ligase [Ktedonobacteraceae bacterium]|nr:aspartate--tRNA(Asn) ligase [Ktedonobacteraceae bacterium]
MERIFTTEVASHIGERVRLQGWLHARRQLGGITFLMLRDGQGMIQAVSEHEAELAPLREAEAELESIIVLEGEMASVPQAPGGVELHEIKLDVLVAVHEITPLTLSKRKLNAQIGSLLDHAPIANRYPARRAIFKLSSTVMNSFRQTLSTRNFVEIQTPKLVGAATESGANVFKLDYFGRPAYLAQSPQLYKQMMVGVFERVFEIGPVFRAEEHDTARHLNQYTSLDLEFGFIENHFTVMALLREVLANIFTDLKERCGPELTMLEAVLPEVPETIPHIHFSEAQELIFRLHKTDVRGEPDLSPQDERWLGAWAKEKFQSDFLYVTGYPMRKRPFYTHPDPEQPAFSNSFDLLFRGTELVTGGQRLHRYQEYLQALELAHIASEPFEAYLQAFRYGMPPHGGLAIGLERLIMQLTGISNVRLAALFPRDIHRLTP